MSEDLYGTEHNIVGMEEATNKRAFGVLYENEQSTLEGGKLANKRMTLRRKGTPPTVQGLPQKPRAGKCRRKDDEKDIALFLDVGNSQTQIAFQKANKSLFWFDDWAGEWKGYQVPTMVTAFRKESGEWARVCGARARMAAHHQHDAVVFDRLKMNLDPNSPYLEDQLEKEKRTGFSDNWTFFLETCIGCVLDSIVNLNEPPTKVRVGIGPPVRWDALVIAKCISSIRMPPQWADKLAMDVFVINEATAAFLGRLNNGLQLGDDQRGILVDIGHGTTVCNSESFF